ncbi:MAG: hypothetical protein KIT80_15340 [Chitinophagaceae bacterium]|nr:hypothetical protein [Chitinophagaceae bacterium]MCW5928288.1 hypothetical protein [Chitinophagaceae bacterium]
MFLTLRSAKVIKCLFLKTGITGTYPYNGLIHIALPPDVMSFVSSTVDASASSRRDLLHNQATMSPGEPLSTTVSWLPAIALNEDPGATSLLINQLTITEKLIK